MKASLLTILLFFSCLAFVSAQKKYIVKVTTLDNKIHKGLMFQVRNKDFLILPNSAHWDFKVKENNISRTKSLDFGIVKNIKIRRKGSIGKGLLFGYVLGTTLGVIMVKDKKAIGNNNDLLGIGAFFKLMAIFMVSSGGGTAIGGIIGESYPHKFEVKKDTTSIQSLKTELKKYEWYHADEGMTK